MRKIGIIPARYESSRFPGKPLAKICGIPMIVRVSRIVSEALGIENTYVATDDVRIKDLVEEYGYSAIMTSDACITGTDRVWEVAQKLKSDIYINVQGDEPLLNPDDILKIAEEKEKYPNYIINGMINLDVNEDPYNLNLPKVLVNKNNNLIYMSRLPIPGVKNQRKGRPQYKKQVCIYAFSYEELKFFGEYGGKSIYERSEDIEILRFFDAPIPIKMVETTSSSLAVDIPDDIQKVETAIQQQGLC